MTAHPTLPHPRTTPGPSTPHTSDPRWVAVVVGIGLAGSVGLTLAAIWATVMHPREAATIAAVHVTCCLTVAAVRHVREIRERPRCIGSWRIACGATPLDLS